MTAKHTPEGVDVIREALANCASLVRVKFGNTDPGATAAMEQAEQALALLSTPPVGDRVEDLREVGLTAPLPSGCRYGTDALDNFDLGRLAATKAILAALAEPRAADVCTACDGRGYTLEPGPRPMSADTMVACAVCDGDGLEPRAAEREAARKLGAIRDLAVTAGATNNPIYHNDIWAILKDAALPPRGVGEGLASRDHDQAVSGALDGAITDGRRFSQNAGAQYRHTKRGGVYTLPFGTAVAGLQTSEPLVDGDVLLIYIGDDGMIWARPPHEFNDGRFEPLSSATPALGDSSRDDLIQTPTPETDNER